MGFRIDENRGPGLSSSAGLSSTAARLNERLNIAADRKAILSDENSVETRRTSAASKLDASNAKMFADIAQQASSAILSLRQEQYNNTKRASEIADQEEQASLQSQNEELQAEIERIAGEATFNGQNVLQGGGLSVAQTDEESTLVLNLSDISNIAEDPQLDITSQASALTALDTMEVYVASANSASGSAASGTNRAEQVLTKSVGTAAQNLVTSGAPTNPDDAQTLANNVRNQILEKYAADKGGLPAQGSINQEIVQSLLVE